MLNPDAAKTALRNLFRRTPVVQLDSLRQTLKPLSLRSVIRRLKDADYLSSYTHSCRYYTLREIPKFDAFGLWYHDGVGFCRAGTLKAAVEELVEQSEAGRTHQELQDLLRVRVHNALLNRVRAQRIGRKQLDNKHWLYVSAKPSRAAKQWSHRQAQKKRTISLVGPLTTAMTIEVLVEVLKSSTVLATPEEVVRRLHHQGVGVPLQHVQWVFEHYELAKKGGPGSARSRR